MKIGKLIQHCGECDIKQYCDLPFNSMYLCTDSRLENIDEETYIKYAEQIQPSKNEILSEKVIKMIQDQN